MKCKNISGKEITNEIWPMLSNAESTMKSPKTVLVILHEQLKVKNSIHFCSAKYNNLEE